MQINSKPSRPTWRTLITNWSNVALPSSNYQEAKIRSFALLASQLKQFLLSNLRRDGSSPHLSQSEFVRSLPLVLSDCNLDVYDKTGAVEAYAFLHLLERYRRTWDAMVALACNGILPFHESALHVLDVGAGPAGSTWALQDFYAVVRETSQPITELSPLTSCNVNVATVERSPAMASWSHYFAEATNRAGPFRPKFNDFREYNAATIREKLRAEEIKILENDDEMSRSQAIRNVDHLNPVWKEEERYNLCVLSYFLTKEEMPRTFREELFSIMKSLRAGGVFAVLGGVGNPYPAVYRELDRLSADAGLRRIEQIDKRPNFYDNCEAVLIKDLYDTIVQFGLTTKMREKVRELLPKAQDVWDIRSPLVGPHNYALRVYRTPDRRDPRK